MKLLFFICISCLSISGCTLYQDKTGSIDSQSVLSGEKYQTILTDQEKAILIRERRVELDSIRKGDFFIARNNPDSALMYYLQVAERLPNDVIIQKKIGHAYFRKKDWRNAYAAYIRTPLGELTESERSELFSSLFFDPDQSNRIQELSKIDLGLYEFDTYHMLDICYTGVRNCMSHIMAYSGTAPIMSVLESTIDDAKKITSDEQYHNFALATKFYELGHYMVVYHIAREILDIRPDYIGVEKLLGFTLFELGNYTDAKKALLSQLEHDPQDRETIVRLGDIFFQLGDYTMANFYFNNAIISGYQHKTDIERKLAYSYSQIGDTPAMMKVLAYLLEEKDATADDAAVAISLALQNGENLKAYVWASNSIKKYPESIQIHALYLTSLRTIGRLKEAQEHILTLPEDTRQEPVIMLEEAIVLLEYHGDLSRARTILEVVHKIDPLADFSIEAENYIQFIDNKILLIDTKKDDTQGEQESWWR